METTFQKVKIQDVIDTDVIFVDVRSPSEFLEDKNPASINIPIFDDAERKLIGTTYKENLKEAYRIGYEIFDKKKDALKKELLNLFKGKKIIINCWRGGARSKAMVEFALELGLDAYMLEGGYKSYRAYVRNELLNYKMPFTLIVLKGLAGTSKTELIKKLDSSIDLEGLAMHRSSTFGAIGLNPRTQKMFESLLFVKLKSLSNEKFVFIEGESCKIGNVFVPISIFSKMTSGVNVNIVSNMENRVKQIVKDYFTHGEDELIKSKILYLKPFLTCKLTDELIAFMDSKDYSSVSRLLLEKYYDLNYDINNISFAYTVNSDDVDSCVLRLLEIKKDLEIKRELESKK
jgi:tRNA 2-selenouridine synthase